MSITDSMVLENKMGERMLKLYQLTHDGSDTAHTIAPGIGYNKAFGSYTAYTPTSSATGLSFAFTVPAGTNGEYSIIAFTN